MRVVFVFLLKREKIEKERKKREEVEKKLKAYEDRLQELISEAKMRQKGE